MKLKRLQISWELLRQAFTPGGHPAGYSVVASGVPEDAQLLGVTMPAGNTIELLLQSETFPPVLPGCAVEFLRPILQRDTPGETPMELSYKEAIELTEFLNAHLKRVPDAEITDAQRAIFERIQAFTTGPDPDPR